MFRWVRESSLVFASPPILAQTNFSSRLQSVGSTTSYADSTFWMSSLSPRGFTLKNFGRVGTLTVATIYLQLIQNRYIFRSFTVLQCSHQHCVPPVASVCTTRCQRCGSRRIPLAAPVVLIVRMERSTAWRISGTFVKRMPRSGSFILGIKSKSQGLKSVEYGGWYSTSQPHRSN